MPATYYVTCNPDFAASTPTLPPPIQIYEDEDSVGAFKPPLTVYPPPFLGVDVNHWNFALPNGEVVTILFRSSPIFSRGARLHGVPPPELQKQTTVTLGRTGTRVNAFLPDYYEIAAPPEKTGTSVEAKALLASLTATTATAVALGPRVTSASLVDTRVTSASLAEAYGLPVSTANVSPLTDVHKDYLEAAQKYYLEKGCLNGFRALGSDVCQGGVWRQRGFKKWVESPVQNEDTPWRHDQIEIAREDWDKPHLLHLPPQDDIEADWLKAALGGPGEAYWKAVEETPT